MVVVAICMGCQQKEISSAKIYIQGDQWEKALAQLELAVQSQPDNPEAHFLLGRTYARTGQFRDMNREFELSLMLSNKYKQDITSEREKYWVEKYNAGITKLRAMDYPKAEVLLRAAVNIDATRSEAYKKLAIAYLRMDKGAKAVQLYSKLLEKHPNDLDLLTSTANLYYSQQQYSKVIPMLKRVLQIEPDHRDALANIALSYDFLGNTEEAFAAYQRAVSANPQDKDLVFLFGIFHYKRKQYPAAIQLFKDVLVLDPDDVESNSNIGNAHLSMAEAVRYKLRSLKGAANSAEEIQRLRDQVIQHYRNSIPYLKKTVDLDPNQPNQWRNLGVAYINTGQKKMGEQALLKAEELKVKTVK